MSTFADYNFAPFLQQALSQIKFTKPTLVQQQVIPVINARRDAVVQAQTGSGKTHAYLLPLLNQLTTSPVVQIVITAPSRELAYQIRLAAEQLLQPAANTWKIGFYVGGTDKQHQIASLRKQQPQIVIGTPGRILDLLKSQHLLVNTTQHLVIDEADMTLDMGFLNDVDRIASAMPSQLQMLVFSATIPQKLQPFLKKYLHQPQNIQLTVPTIIASNITNWALFTRGRDRKQVLYQVLTMGQPYLALIFANTKTVVTQIYEYLDARGLNVTQLHGDLPARTRRRTMKAIENMEYQYVVASDLAARGIDIPGVSHVINAEIPHEDEFFIHRVGRTGRNQMSGLAITLFDPDEIDKISHLEELGIKFVSKQIKNHEFEDYQLNQRRQRRIQSSALDPGLRGLVKKQQRKKKPGYRKKIKQAIKTDRAQKRKLAQRLQKKQQRQARKQQP